MPKKLLILGGSRYILPVIEAAHQLDCEVVTCDYLPDNVAHRYSDSYRNASIVDKDAVLAVARDIRADGIMSFAADPGVVSAAYAAEKMGLPFQGSYEAASVLQDKERFRSFLRENGFNCPEAWSFSSAEEAASSAGDIGYPVIVKPTDSAGSKGCSRVDGPEGLAGAVEYALSFSLKKACIVERFLEKAFPSSDADGFAVAGRFECVSFTSQLFDPLAPNPYAPAAYTMPAAMPGWAQEELASELQRLADLLGLRDGVFNIETRVAPDGKAYIMEVSPRGGGNRLSEMLRFATAGKVDLVRASVQAALGMPVDGVAEPEYDGFWYQAVLHSGRAGVFGGVEYASGFREAHVAEEQLWVGEGDVVEGFSSANFAFGSAMVRFDSQEQLKAFCDDPSIFMSVGVS